MEQLARQAPQQTKVQPHRSARDAKSHHRAKFKALAHDLMYGLLFLRQRAEATTRNEAEGAFSIPKSQRSERGRRLSTTVTATECQEIQEEVDEVSPDRLYIGQGPSMASTSSGKLATTLGMCTPTPAWPWAGSGQCNQAPYTPYNSQSMRLPSTAWPCASPQSCGLGMPSSPPGQILETDLRVVICTEGSPLSRQFL